MEMSPKDLKRLYKYLKLLTKEQVSELCEVAYERTPNLDLKVLKECQFYLKDLSDKSTEDRFVEVILEGKNAKKKKGENLPEVPAELFSRRDFMQFLPTVLGLWGIGGAWSETAKGIGPIGPGIVIAMQNLSGQNTAFTVEPESPPRVVIRLRYNISTGDYGSWDGDKKSDDKNKKQITVPSKSKVSDKGSDAGVNITFHNLNDDSTHSVNTPFVDFSIKPGDYVITAE